MYDSAFLFNLYENGELRRYLKELVKTLDIDV